jgi:hypothetical protein
MQEGKNWIFPKEINANRFFWDSHWLELEIWSNHSCPSMRPNGGSVAMDSDVDLLIYFDKLNLPSRQKLSKKSQYTCISALFGLHKVVVKFYLAELIYNYNNFTVISFYRLRLDCPCLK